MFTSVINKKSAINTAYVYLLISILIMALGLIYEEFSHGVYSRFMIYAFMFPLVGGAFPFFTIGLFSVRYPCKVARSLYHCGIATITVGSIVRGVLNIYGTVNPLDKIYWIAGPIFLLAALIIYVISLFLKKRS